VRAYSGRAAGIKALHCKDEPQMNRDAMLRNEVFEQGREIFFSWVGEPA
jgi:hypothetical protein